MLDIEDVINPDLLRDGKPKLPNNPSAEPDAEEPVDAEQLIGEQGELGALMAASEEQVPALLKRMREDYEGFLEHERVQWRVNALRRRGVSHIRPQTDEDGRWFVWKSPAVRSSEGRSVNYLGDLLRKLTAMLFADPPAAEVIPPNGDDEAEERAIRATRVLNDLHGEHALHTPFKARLAFDRSGAFASAFVVTTADLRGGERLPIRLQAGWDPATGRAAMTEDEALDDPLTGTEWPAYRSMFVTPDGRLTESESEAARRFAPRLRKKIVTGNNLYIFPHTAEWIGDAHGALLLEYVTVGEMRKELTPEQAEQLKNREWRQKLLSARTNHDLDVLAPGQRKRDLEASREGDEALVLRCEYWHEACFDYAEGAHVVTFGDLIVAKREPWVSSVAGKEVRRLLPVTQYKQFSEGRGGPYGVAGAELLGPGNEVHAEAFGAFLDILDRIRNRKVFVPTTSPINPAILNNPSYRYIPIAPGQEPSDEKLPELPRAAGDLLGLARQQLETIISLGQTAQGLEAKNVDSGRHAWAIVQQVHAQLSELISNIERGFVRDSRIEMQTVVCDYTLEQQLRYMGDGGEWVVESWLGSDFADTTDVRLRPGTLTMMTAEQKQQEAVQFAQLGILKPHELREFVRGNVGARVGIEDDPHLQRVRGQIHRWRKGPPKGWQPPTPPMQPEVINGIPTGRQTPVLIGGLPATPPPDPLLSEIFSPSPADTLPDVAPMRLYELAKAAASPFYQRAHPEWKRALDMELMKMQQAIAAFQAPPVPTTEEKQRDPREAPDAPGSTPATSPLQAVA